MKKQIDQTLYIDLQAAVPAGICHICGGALYAPSRLCLRCRRDVP